MSRSRARASKAMSSLVTASTAKPTDMDWQAQYDGLISMRRLTVHHSRLVIPQLHQFTLALIPADSCEAPSPRWRWRSCGR